MNADCADGEKSVANKIFCSLMRVGVVTAGMTNLLAKPEVVRLASVLSKPRSGFDIGLQTGTGLGCPAV
jgi:hypothetical protein